MPAHEVFHRSSSSASLTFTGGELKVKEAAESSGYGVRALENGRLGFAYCQAEAGVTDALEKARKLSRFAVKSGFSFAPRARVPAPSIYDPALAGAEYKGLKALLDEAREAAQSLGGMPRVILSSDTSATSLNNTEGFSGEYRKTHFSLYCECMHADGFGFSYFSSHRVPSSVEGVGRKAAEMAKAMQGAEKPEAGEYTVVLELEALDSFLDVLMPSFSGDWKRRKITRVEAGKKMFSPAFTLHEDGLAEGSGSRPFDDEGTPSAARPLVERGKVRGFLFDRETAALAKEKSSGACSRGSYESPPGIGQANIVIEGGGHSDLSDIGRHLEVHSVHGSHTANPTTGDFGLEVSVAFLLDKGEKKPVRGFMLSGNIFDMFSKIEAMEKEVRTLGGLIAPRIAFRGVRAVC
jgi:PmbA protein